MSTLDGTTGKLYHTVWESGRLHDREPMRVFRSAEKFIFDAKFVEFGLIKLGMDFADQLAEHQLLRLPFPAVVFQLGPIVDDEPNLVPWLSVEHHYVALAWQDGNDIKGRLYVIGKSGECSSGEATYHVPNGMTAQRLMTDHSLAKSSIIGDPQIEGISPAEHEVERAGLAFFLLVMFGGLGCLNSSGIEIEAKRTPKFINLQRKKKSEAPIFGHNLVKIDLSKVQMPGWVQAGNSHASPRLHWRRGHVRRLSSGKMSIVRPCLVGDPSRGAVSKDYRVAA